MGTGNGVSNLPLYLTNSFKYVVCFSSFFRINGDVALIPVSSQFETDIKNLSSSPSSKEDFQKLLCDWQQFINVDVSIDIIKLLYCYKIIVGSEFLVL